LICAFSDCRGCFEALSLNRTLRTPIRASERRQCTASCCWRVEVHHVAKLADLGRAGERPPWADLMAARHRKTLVVCGNCHADIHGKNPVPALTE
jgi:hypothetical protein